MSTFLRVVAARALATAPASVRPRLRSRYEPAPGIPALRLPATPLPARLAVRRSGSPDWPTGAVTADADALAGEPGAARLADRIHPTGQAPSHRGAAAGQADPAGPADPATADEAAPADEAGPAVPADLTRPQRPRRAGPGDAYRIPPTTSPWPGESADTDAAVAATVPVRGPRPGGPPPRAAQPQDPGVTVTDGGTASALRGGKQAASAKPPEPGATDTVRPQPRVHHLTAIVERTDASPIYHGTPVAPILPPGPAEARSASPPSISVTIGRVDVVAVVETTPQRASRPASRPPAPSLEGYLRERTRRSR